MGKLRRCVPATGSTDNVTGSDDAALAPTEREAVLSFHRAQVNNAIYLNSMDASAAGLPKSSMPPEKVLAEYPDLREKFGLAHEDQHPNLEIKEPNTERGRHHGFNFFSAHLYLKLIFALCIAIQKIFLQCALEHRTSQANKG